MEIKVSEEQFGIDDNYRQWQFCRSMDEETLDLHGKMSCEILQGYLDYLTRHYKGNTGPEINSLEEAFATEELNGNMKTDKFMGGATKPL